MKITSLGSGSSGNAFCIQVDGSTVLLDAGVPVRSLARVFTEIAETGAPLSAILISHEHHDHVCSLARLIAGHAPVPCFATRGTIEAMRTSCPIEWQTIRPLEAFDVDGLTITPIPVSHDAAEPVGFRLTDGRTTVAVATDLGEVNPDIEAACRDADLIILESNYDERMLERGPYPAHLKRRIRGKLGHLSNSEAARLFERCVTSVTRQIWLAHLSAENNRPELAVAETNSRLDSHLGPDVVALPRRGRPVRWDSSAQSSNRQMRLPFA